MVCRAGLDESSAPRNISPLDAMVMCQDWPHSAGGASRATARNGSYDNMICRAGLDESNAPRNISPLEAMAMCQDLPHSAGGASGATPQQNNRYTSIG